jgi:hypothetical protein
MHNPLKRFLYPLYSLGIVSSNLSLFEKVRGALIGPEIPGENDLLEAVTGILNGISDAELQHLFRSWIEHVETVIVAGEDYLAE